MEKAPRNPLEMNTEEWEFLPDNTSFLEFGLEDVKDLLSNEIMYMDYFREEPKLIQQQQLKEKSPTEILANKNHINKDHEEAQLKDISISHVFFKLKPMGEEELTDMKASSPKHCAVELVAPQLTQPPPPFMLEFSKGGEAEEKTSAAQEEEEEEEKPVCRRRLTGVGALCSMGVAAAATICILVLGGQQRRWQMQHHRQQNHVLRFHIHADDKINPISILSKAYIIQGLTQVVEQASRLNQALAAARGAPMMMRTAKISFGGYYDGA